MAYQEWSYILGTINLTPLFQVIVLTWVPTSTYPYENIELVNEDIILASDENECKYEMDMENFNSIIGKQREAKGEYFREYGWILYFLPSKQ